MSKFSVELRDQASEYVTAQAKKRSTTKSEVVRKALNVFATLDDDNLEVILHNKTTGEKTKLLIA